MASAGSTAAGLAPGAEAGVAAAASVRRRRVGWAWLFPSVFLVYVALFFLLPTGVILVEAFRDQGTTTTAARFTTANVSTTLQGSYATSLVHSIGLSAVTAVLGGVLGLVLAWAVVTTESPVFGRLVSSASAVLANFGGLPLAFLFVAAIGNAGILTRGLAQLGAPVPQNFLYSLTGVEIVYLYFLVPLMVLVITPALEGLRPQWREASDNLGGGALHYWRHVAGPVLAPSVVGSVALLFCSAFSAYATAAALTNGTLAITPLAISSALSGNVLVGYENIGYALALDMVVVVVPLTIVYQLMQRRTSRWLA